MTRALTRSTAKHVIPSQELIPLLDLEPESELQQEICDIIDELDIMLYIVKQQKEIISHFKTNAEEILISEQNENKNIGREDQDKEKKLIDDLKYKVFNKRATGILDDVCRQVGELDSLKDSAVDELISLKQQQASVVQAYQATKQGEETAMQGKAIMVFTVMTIIFLPLSFMSSLFGMNAVELTASNVTMPGDTLQQLTSFWPTTFRRQIFIMFLASFGAVLIVTILAFSPLIRTFFWSIIRLSATSILFVFHIRGSRVFSDSAHPSYSQRLTKWTDEKIQHLKDRMQSSR